MRWLITAARRILGQVRAYFDVEWDFNSVGAIPAEYVNGSAFFDHIDQVKWTIHFALVSAFSATITHYCFWNFGGIITLMEFLRIFVELRSMRPRARGHDLRRKRILLNMAAFLGGASLGPLLELFFNIHPSAFIVTHMEACMVFVAFQMAFLLRESLIQIYILGIVLSAIVFQITLHILVGPIAVDYSDEWTFKIFAGLMGFTIPYFPAYTLRTAYRAYWHNEDDVQHALAFFTEFPVICFHFCRLWVGLIAMRPALHNLHTEE